MKINESKVKFEDGHFPRDSMVQDGGVFVLTNIFYQPICFNQLIFTLYIIFFFTNHFIHTNDSHNIFFYQPFYLYKWLSYPLKMSLTVPILRKVFIQYYYLIYILLLSHSAVFHLLQNWDKNHLQNPLNKQLDFLYLSCP